MGSGSVIFRAGLAAWSRIAHTIGNFQARVILTVVYFVALGPFALVARRRGGPRASTLWRDRSDAPPTLDAARRQF